MKGFPMWQLILFAVCILILAVVVSRISKRKPEAETYICDRCGEKNCICRKEETTEEQGPPPSE